MVGFGDWGGEAIQSAMLTTMQSTMLQYNTKKGYANAENTVSHTISAAQYWHSGEGPGGSAR